MTETPELYEPAGMPTEIKVVGGYEFSGFYPTEAEVAAAIAFVAEHCDPATTSPYDMDRNTVKLVIAAAGDRTIEKKPDRRTRTLALVDGRQVIVTGEGCAENAQYSYALAPTDE